MLRYSQVDTHDPHTLRSAWLRAKLIVTARKIITMANLQHMCGKLLTTMVEVWPSITHEAKWIRIKASTECFGTIQ